MVGVAAAQTMSGDCTITNAGTITCTKTNGVSFGAMATLGVAATGDLTGNWPNITVAKTQGLAWKSGATYSSGQVPTWNITNNQFEPSTPSGGSAACTTSASLGMDPTGATNNDTQLAAWIATLSSATNHATCLEFGVGLFKFAVAPIIPLPNALWSTTSTTSNTIGLGSKTFTVASCTGIVAGNQLFAYHNSLTAENLMGGTVTSCISTTLIMNSTLVGGSGTFTSWGIIQTTNGTFGGTNSTAAVTFKGQGVDATELRFVGGVAGPTFKFAGTVQQLTVTGMSITTDMAGAGTACVLLTNTYPFIGAQQNINQFRNVTCRGSDGYGQTNYWTAGFVANYVSNVNFDAIQYFGPSGASPPAASTAISFTNPGANGCLSNTGQPWQCGENYNITNSYINNANAGVSYGDNTQFVNISHTQFLNSNYGVFATGAGVLQGLWVNNNIFFTYKNGVVDTSGIKNIFISGNFIAINPGFYGIQLNNNWAFTVANNQFTPFSSAPLGCIYIAGPSNDISIVEGNMCSSGGGPTITNGIVLDTASTLVRVSSNSVNGATNPLVNSGTGNFVGASFVGAPTASFSSSQGTVTHQ
jgi:hypothetical protein